MGLKITVRTTGLNREIRRLQGLAKAIGDDEVLVEAAKTMARDARKANLKGWPTGRTRRAVTWDIVEHVIIVTFTSVYAKSEDSIKGVAKWILKYFRPRMKKYIKIIEKNIVDTYRKGR